MEIHHGTSSQQSVKALCEELIGLCLQSMRSRDKWHRLELTSAALALSGRLQEALVESRKRQMTALARDRWPQKRIARVAGCSPSYVSRVAREAGVPARVSRDDDEDGPHLLRAG